MTVEREEELEGIGVEDLDRRVEEGDGEELAIGRVLDGEDIVGHLERLGVSDGQDPVDGSTLDLGGNLSDLEIPELDVLVGGTGNESSTVGANVERPEGPVVGENGLEKGGRGEVVKEKSARLGTDDDLRIERGSARRREEMEQGTYMTVTGEESAANGVTALHRPHTLGRLPVPDLERALGGRSDELVIGRDGEGAHVGAMAGDIEGVLLDGFDGGRFGGGRWGEGVDFERVVGESCQDLRKEEPGQRRRGESRESVEIMTYLHISLGLEGLGREGERPNLASRPQYRPHSQPIPPLWLSILADRNLLILILVFFSRLALALALAILLLLPLPPPPPCQLLPQLLLGPQSEDVDGFLSRVDGKNRKGRVEGDLGNVVRVGGVGEGESGDGGYGAAKLAFYGLIRKDALAENLLIDLPAFNLALSTSGDENARQVVVSERPSLAAVADDRLDAVLGREVEELDEGVLGGGDEVVRRLLARLFLCRRGGRLVLVVLSSDGVPAHKLQSRNLVPVTPQPEHADLSNHVPHDHVGVLASTGEPSAVLVPAKGGHGALVAIEGDYNGLSGGGPEADGAIGVAYSEGIPVDRGAREAGNERAKASLVPHGVL